MQQRCICATRFMLQSHYNTGYIYYPFKCLPHKMVKHSEQLIGKFPTNYLRVFDHFVGWYLKGYVSVACSSFYTGTYYIIKPDG